MFLILILDIYLTINALIQLLIKDARITKKLHLFYPIILAYLYSDYDNQANN